MTRKAKTSVGTFGGAATLAEENFKERSLCYEAIPSGGPLSAPPL